MLQIECERKIIKNDDTNVEMKFSDSTDGFESASGRENSESRKGNSEPNSKTVSDFLVVLIVWFAFV